jgi:DNA primase
MSQIQTVKEATDVVALIGERIRLSRSGQNWKGLCPFHSEKTPSFYVNEAMQRYKCFGCGESGDCFTFLEKVDNLTFYETLKVLAERAGITLEERFADPEDRKREQMLEALRLAAEYYHYLLVTHPIGKVAREYVQNRHVHSEVMRSFQIGYAVDAWDGLTTYLHKKKGFSLDVLLGAGLVLPRSGGGSFAQDRSVYDRFRGRLMFPLMDSRGRVVGFSGRVLDPHAKEAKYINTSETPLYHKGQLLFGYWQNRDALRKEKTAVVVEGEFDVLSSIQAHVDHVVGFKGSALTKEQVSLLRRSVETLVFSFDEDAAGQKACVRAIEVAQAANIDIRVLRLPADVQQKDPDEVARETPEVWRQAVRSAIPAYEFLIQFAVQQGNSNTASGKSRIVDQVVPIFRMMTHAVEQEHYIRMLAAALGVSQTALNTDVLARLKSRVALDHAPQPVAKSVHQRHGVQPRTALEKQVMITLFQAPEIRMLDAATALHALIETPEYQHLLQLLIQKGSATFTLASWVKSLAADEQQTLAELLIQPSDEVEVAAVTATQPDEEHWNAAWDRCILLLRESATKSQRKKLAEELGVLERVPEEQRSDALSARYEALLQSLAQLGKTK